jgi:5-formyltetrahydrofolate cyclo-ligase
VYLAYGSEADLADVIAVARQRRCHLYLPVITDYRRNRMSFVAFDEGARMRVNRYGIAEPKTSGISAAASRIAVRHLDLVLVPLVAVDARGWRLGSGAGFYDRCLHQLRPHRSSGPGWRRPKLIGVGYELQRVPHLEPGPWDVPLDAVVTERDLYRLPLATRARNDLHSICHSS